MQDKPDIPAQAQEGQPGEERVMTPPPDYMPKHPGVGKLKGRVAFVSGGDSGIGRAVAVLFAREGCRVAIAYLEEDRDAEETREAIEAEGTECLLIKGDLADSAFARQAIQETVQRFGKLDIVVNNAAVQYAANDLREITEAQLRRTFDSNVMAYFFVTQAALDHLKEGAAIINTSSVNAFAGMSSLVDYSSTRGAIVAFSRSMAQQLADKGIRVNTVAPGPIWTPFIPSTFPAEKVEGFGEGSTLLGRPGQPWEVATSYLFLASDDGSYFTGQTLHPNGGKIVGA